LVAIGRDAKTDDLGLGEVGVETNPKNKKLICSDTEQTNVDYIYGLGKSQSRALFHAIPRESSFID